MSNLLQEPGARSSAGAFALWAGPAYSQRRVTNAFCATVYNEPDSALRATLRSVLLALRHSYFHVGSGASRSLICILVDGRAQMHPSLRGWLKQVQLMLDAPHRFANLDVHDTSH